MKKSNNKKKLTGSVVYYGCRFFMGFEWNPIETAPIGVDILVYCPDMPEKPIRLVRARRTFDNEIRFVDELPNFANTLSSAQPCKLPLGAWIWVYPTHWTPLPEPPDSEVNPEKGLRL